MKNAFRRLWAETDGVLSFEWALLLTVMVIGVVAGLSAARDAIIDEFGDVAQAMLAVDHSMTIAFPLQTIVHNAADPSSASDSGFSDAQFYSDCERSLAPQGNTAGIETES
jgi:Flp pilus assembly pilin Flp